MMHKKLAYIYYGSQLYTSTDKKLKEIDCLYYYINIPSDPLNFLLCNYTHWDNQAISGASVEWWPDYVQYESHWFDQGDEEPAESQRGDVKFLQVARPYCLDKLQTTYSMKDFSSVIFSSGL